MKINNIDTLKNTSKLSIQFNLDGFSFSIYNKIEKETTYFKHYSFKEPAKTPEALLDKIVPIFNTDTYLQNDFDDILVIHQNSLSTLVPGTFFCDNNLKDYLNLNIKTLATDFITFDELAPHKCNVVYIPYVNINNYLFNNFGSFEYKHHSTVFLEKITRLNTSKETTMYVNVHNNSIDVAVLNHTKLLLYNQFTYTSKEDFLYFILFVAEQLGLDTSNFTLNLTGNITTHSTTYKLLYKYIKHVSFLEQDSKIYTVLNLEKHSNFVTIPA